MNESVTVCFCVCVCTVTDFFAGDQANGVKFCTAVHRRPKQGISHFGERCSTKSPKSDESASAPPSPRRSQRLPFGSRTHDRERHVGVVSACVDIYGHPRRRTCLLYTFLSHNLTCVLPVDSKVRGQKSSCIIWSTVRRTYRLFSVTYRLSKCSHFWLPNLSFSSLFELKIHQEI